MHCYVCAGHGIERPAVGLCRSCTRASVWSTCTTLPRACPPASSPAATTTPGTRPEPLACAASAGPPHTTFWPERRRSRWPSVRGPIQPPVGCVAMSAPLPPHGGDVLAPQCRVGDRPAPGADCTAADARSCR